MTGDPGSLARGAALFNAGAYFEAHEAWEDEWRVADPGPRRALLQGLIQAAAALHKLTRTGDAASAARILTRALAKLGPIADDEPAAAPLRLEPFRAGLARCLEAVATLAPGAQFDRALVPRLELVEPAPP